MKQRIFTLDLGPATDFNNVTLAYIDASLLTAIEVGFQQPNAGQNPSKYSIALIGRVGTTSAFPIGYFQYWDTEQQALDAAQLWKVRLQNFRHPDTIFDWVCSDDPSHHFLMYVDVTALEAVYVDSIPSGPSNAQWGVRLVSSFIDPTVRFSGEKLFATQTEALAEAQIWVDRMEAAK
jgi:hypothetical protein